MGDPGFYDIFTSVSSCFLQEDLLEGEEVARCPSCSLVIRVIYDEGFMDSPTQVFEAAKVTA